MIVLLTSVFIIPVVFGVWGAYRSLKAWQGCEVVGTGYKCADGRQYP